MKRFVRALEHATLLLLLALTALIASTTRLPAQNRYEWSVFSSLKEGRSITVDDRGVVWTATTGGIFSYDPVADSFRVYRTTEGLLKLSALSIAFDTSSGKRRSQVSVDLESLRQLSTDPGTDSFAGVRVVVDVDDSADQLTAPTELSSLDLGAVLDEFLKSFTAGAMGSASSSFSMSGSYSG